MIHVCSLARLHATVENTGARHVVSLLSDEAPIERPSAIVEKNHLWLRMHDISAPLDGYILPHEEHVAHLISFVRRWDRRTPLVVHCYAGISRSTASAFTTVCALNPHRDERSIAAQAAPSGRSRRRMGAPSGMLAFILSRGPRKEHGLAAWRKMGYRNILHASTF